MKSFLAGAGMVIAGIYAVRVIDRFTGGFLKS